MTNKKLKAVSILIGAAFFASANLPGQTTSEIRDFNSNIVNGDTMHFWVAAGSAHYIDFNQYNVGTAPVTYKVHKNEVTMVPGATAWFCIYHNADPSDVQSQCYIPSVTTSGNFATDTGDFNMLLSDFNAGPNFGTSIVRYKFYDINNTNDSAEITLIYNVTPVGIAESFTASGSLGNVYPNPANEAVAVEFLSGESRRSEIVITDLSGREVLREQASSSSGIMMLNTASWAEGMYLISLVSDGHTVSRKKLIVE